MKLTSCRLIFKCQPEQKMMDAKMLMAYSSASLLQNRMLYAGFRLVTMSDLTKNKAGFIKGFYWVKLDKDYDWAIAYFDGEDDEINTWSMCGEDPSYSAEDFLIIGERLCPPS
jgi:hypothetical protein